MDKKKKPKQGLKRILLNNLRILVKVARLTPDYFIAVIFWGILWGVINSIESIFTLRLFNALDIGGSFAELAGIIGIMALFYTIAYAVDVYYWETYRPLKKQKLELKLHGELFDKARKIEVACYDDPEFYNDFVWAMDEAGNRADDVLTDFGKTIDRVLATGTLITLLFSIDLWVAVILITFSILSMLLRQTGNRMYFKKENERKPLNRKRDYLNRVFRLNEYAKEIRISHVTDILMRETDETTDELIKCEKKYGFKQFCLWGLVGNPISQLMFGGIMLYMTYLLFNGQVLAGEFAATIGMIWRVRWMLTTSVEQFMKFPQHSLFLEKYYGFLAYEPKLKSGKDEVPEFKSLEFKDVSFTYDFSDKPKYKFHEDKKEEQPKYEALKKINLKLNKGEKIAIVGYNGAGKTTLIKLIMRLYDPTSGQILINGKDVKLYDLEEYRSRIGTVFQDFKIFAASIGENVINGEYDDEKDKETVITALDAAGFTSKLSTLKNGVDTILTREFDDEGTELSGGESQKIAIARVFAKPFELIIMDEPSSALDPIAEYELNQAILKYAADKTVIFISHRLSTTRMADRIYMFDSGNLTETGTHEELMEREGKYARMFNLQAEKYK